MKRPTREQALAELDDLYSQMPKLECKGLCYDSCTAIDASELERERLAERGIQLPEKTSHRRLLELIATNQTPRCPALGPLNNCTVYDVRPFTCRAFGMVRDRYTDAGFAHKGPMMCDHGCTPEGTISLHEYARILREIDDLSFLVTGVRRR